VRKEQGLDGEIELVYAFARLVQVNFATLQGYSFRAQGVRRRVQGES